MGQTLFKKHSRFQNFDELFYFGMTRLGNKNLDVFIQCKYTRTILRKKNMRQTPSTKNSKFQNAENVHEIFFCGKTRLRNVV